MVHPGGQNVHLGTVVFTPYSFTTPRDAFRWSSCQNRFSCLSNSWAKAGSVAAAVWLCAKRWFVMTTCRGGGRVRVRVRVKGSYRDKGKCKGRARVGGSR